MTTRVFISHSRQDAELAHRIAVELEKSGLSAVDPEHRISQGETWRSAVRAAMAQSDAVVAVVGSPLDVDNTWVSYEVGMAEAKSMPVIVMAPDTHPVSDLPPDLQDSRVRTFDPMAPERGARAVAREILAAA